MGLANILAITINTLGNVLVYLIFGRVILSWFNLSPDNPFLRFFYFVTEPILAPIRNLIQSFTKRPMMLDFSPVIAWLLLDYLIIPWLTRFVYFIFK